LLKQTLPRTNRVEARRVVRCLILIQRDARAVPDARERVVVDDVALDEKVIRLARSEASLSVVVDVAASDANVARPLDADADSVEAERPQLEVLEGEEAAVRHGDRGAVALGVRGADHKRLLAALAAHPAKGDPLLRRAIFVRELEAFGVSSRCHQHGVARERTVGGLLQRAPRRCHLLRLAWRTAVVSAG
jgi:hypothetical protein